MSCVTQSLLADISLAASRQFSLLDQAVLVLSGLKKKKIQIDDMTSEEVDDR